MTFFVQVVEEASVQAPAIAAQSSNGFFSLWLPWVLINVVLLGAIVFGLYWLIRLAVRHGNQDKGRHA